MMTSAQAGRRSRRRTGALGHRTRPARRFGHRAVDVGEPGVRPRRECAQPRQRRSVSLRPDSDRRHLVASV